VSDVAGRSVLVTGGTGTFGSCVAVRLQQLGAGRVVIYSRDEKKHWDMAQRYPELDYVVGDVRDRDRLHEAMRGVDVVFHAAALKHVPGCEHHPLEAVKTNVLGAENVCAAARAAGVQSVIALSTDKAVKPVNVMGTTKALMERIVCSAQRKIGPIFCCVRYGNVLGSRGSVVPLFRSQIAAGRALTLTVPQMTRFLMTLEQAVELVLYALEHARGGEIFVRRVPASTVEDLARALVRYESPQGDDHLMRTTGMRPGEKLDEVLVNDYELAVAETPDEHYFVVPAAANRSEPLNFLRPSDPRNEYTSANTTRLQSLADIYALVKASDSQNALSSAS